MVKKICFWGVHLGGSRGGWYPQIMSKYLSLKYLLISKKNWHPSLSRSKNWFFGAPFWGGSRGGGTPKSCMSKYFSLKYLLISKKNGTLGYMVKKICFWGGPFGGVPGGVVPPNYVKIFVSQISTDIQKNWHPSLSRSKNWFFGAPFWGGSRGSCPKKISGDTIAYVPQQLHTKIRFLCFVV